MVGAWRLTSDMEDDGAARVLLLLNGIFYVVSFVALS